MRDQAPQRGLAGGWADGAGGFTQSDDALDGCSTFDFEIAGFVGEGQARGQVSIGTRGAQSERIDVGIDGTRREIDQGDGDLRAFVAYSRGLTAVGQPEGLLLILLRGVAEGIEGLK